MTHCIAGALGSKWGNPYRIDKTNKNSQKICLERYEDHIRRNPDIVASPCHGDILIKLYKEGQDPNTSSLRSDDPEFISVLSVCGRKGGK